MNLHKVIGLFFFFQALIYPLLAQNTTNDTEVITITPKVSKDLKNFRYLTVNDGFTRNSVFKIMQDKKGFMWFALWDGLYRFDGNKLTNAIPNTDMSHTKRSTNSMLSDGKNRIWMGTSSGIFIWDAPKMKEFAFNTKTEQGDSISGYINNLYKDKFDNIWIINKSKKVFLYNIEKGILKNLSNIFAKHNFRISKIYIDDKENIFVTTTSQGIIQLKGNHPKSGNPFEATQWKIIKPTIFHYFETSYVDQVFQDSHQNYWVGTNTHIFHIIPQKNGQSPCIYRFENSRKEINQIRVNNFNQGGNYVYAATNQGLLTFHLDTTETIWNLPNFTEEHHLNDKSLTDIYIDNEGGLWIASFYGGVNYLHPTNTNFSHHIDLNKNIEGHVISSITEDQYNNIWMAVEDNGICQWNRKTNTIKNFNSSSHNGYCPTFHNVQSIYADQDQLYVGMYLGGLDVVNLKTMSHENFNSKHSSPDHLPNSIYAFHKWTPQELLIGTLDGLFRFNTHSHEFHRIKEVKGKINCITKDENGDLWISSLQNGFYRYSCIGRTWENYKENQNDSLKTIGNSITTIYPMNPSIYIGTQGNGLWIFNKNTHNYQQVAPQIFKDAIIFTILQKGETLWITTNTGLFAYNINSQEAKQYTIQDGLRSNQFKENSGIITTDNLFVVGGLNGFNCFRPANIKNNTHMPQVMLTDFYLFNKPANIHETDCPLEQSITYTKQIDLDQRYHSFAFKFSSSSYSDISKNKYEYKLEPFEKEWQRAPETNGMASYTNLPAGIYKFHVRTSNGQGAWSEEKCIAVNIHAYWWLSWPMKLIYLIIILLITTKLTHLYLTKKKKEMYLFRMEKDQEVYQSKMKFFTYMVHEIRTPLTLILGPLNSIMNKKEHTVKEVLPDLKIIERNGKRLVALVNQLMDFRKIEENSFSIQVGTFEIKELVQQIAKDFSFYNVQKPVIFEYDFPETKCWAKIDREAFTKILTNLLSNALKFTTDWIKVSLKLSNDHEFWELSIADNGKGIPANEQISIFDSFYQVHQDLPGDYVGTGIGLFVVRKLLEIQNGSIRVESKINEGAKFIATLPWAPAPENLQINENEGSETDRTTLTESEKKQDTTKLRKRLLIAEDNDEMRAYIVSLFAEDYDIETFDNGKAALEATQTTNFDLVLTDLMMPVMDGMTLCKTLKRQSGTCHIPIVILTAKDDENSQKEGFESEADMYVTKPFSAKVLQSCIKSIFRNRERLSKQFYSKPETTAEVLYTNDADKAFLERLDDLINQRLSDCNLSIDKLATDMAMGRSVFYQKVKGVTGLTPNDYIRTFRLKKAVSFFQQGETHINEVCYRVGFSSPSYFSKRFTLQFGISPSDYLKTKINEKK